MASPIHPDPDFPFGVDCPSCTPSPFLPGRTPLVFRVVFHNVTTCPTWPDFPNELLIDAIQRDVTPCLWQGGVTIDGVQWGLYLDLTVSSLRLDMLYPSILPAFYGEFDLCSAGPFDNTLFCRGAVATGGTAYIIPITPPEVYRLAVELSLQPEPRALFQHSQAADPNQTFTRLTGRDAPGSVLILSE